MIDTHCHLYVEAFEPDRQEMLSRARAAGVTDFFLPAIDKDHIQAMEDMRNLTGCHLLAGLHPCSVKEDYEFELEIVEKQLKRGGIWGIGETGLDLYWDKTWIKPQQEALARQAEMALEYDLPVILHTREALPQTIEIISTYKSRGLTGIFHCFGGTLDEARQIMDLGFFMGIGGVLTYKKSGLDAVLAEVPLEYLVLETDAPYLSPVPFRGKRNESSYLVQIAQKLAEVKGVSLKEIDQITTLNARKVFKMDD